MKCSICKYLVVNSNNVPAQQWCSKYNICCYDVAKCDIGGSNAL